MMYTSTSTATIAVLGLAAVCNGHIKMTNPVPFGQSTLNNSPLNTKEDGDTTSDFPCKQRSGVYDTESAGTSLALGEVFSNVSFVGSAVHGGGSCQFSITYDLEPTADSVFKVIHSIEGGCPMKNIAGNNDGDATQIDPDTYSLTVPANIPSGKATLSWTWFNKVGNREMYQNCAPITLTAASSKRSEIDSLLNHNQSMIMKRDSAAFDALPDMFVANIVGSTCATVDGDLGFPNPGNSVEQFGLATQPVLLAPTGCSSATVAGSSAASATPTTASPSFSASSSAAAPVVSSQLKTSAASAPAVSTSASVAAPVASSQSATSASPVSTGGVGSMTAGTACATEGMWNCIRGTSYQQCASGEWSIARPLAVGTSCTPGQSMNIGIVRRAYHPHSKRGN